MKDHKKEPLNTTLQELKLKPSNPLKAGIPLASEGAFEIRAKEKEREAQKTQGVKLFQTFEKALNKGEIKKPIKLTGTFKYNLDDDGSGKHAIMPDFAD